MRPLIKVRFQIVLAAENGRRHAAPHDDALRNDGNEFLEPVEEK
jgi:hypothetical protein